MTRVNKQKALVAIRRIMKDNLFRRQVISKQGRLCMNRLHAYQTSSHLFIKPQEREGKAYHVELLVDDSGSMYICNRARAAFEAAQKIAGVLGAYCDLKITTFKYIEEKYGYKEFSKMDFDEYESWSSKKYLDTKKIDGETHFVKGKEYENTAGNWEVCNIVNAANRLRKEEGTKIIIILLDGKISMDDFTQSDAKEINLYVSGLPVRKYNRGTYVDDIKRIEKDGIKVKAFGICTDQPEEYFSDFTEIKHPDKIYEELIKFLTAATK